MTKDTCTTGPADSESQLVAMCQLRERADRLYMIGQWRLAAQLLLELAAGGNAEPPEGAPLNG